MKLLKISVLLLLAMIPLSAQDQSATEWVSVARQSQALFKQAHFAEAADSARHALQLAKHFGSSDPKLASTYFLLGVIYRDWGHCGESRANYLHAIAIWRRQPVPNPHYTFNAITNLLSVMCECDEFDAAEKAFRTYQPDLLRYRSDTLDDARLLSVKAVLARGRKNYPEAEALFRQTLELMEKSSRATPVDVAAERNNLAVVLDREKRYANSLEESERAIAFFEQNAPKNPSLVASLNSAACTLAVLGRREEADRMFQRALNVARDFYGEENRITAKIMLNYAHVLRENRETPAAEALRKKGAETFRNSLARDAGTIDVEELRATKK